MCLRTLSLMFSSDNPDGLCHQRSYFRLTFLSILGILGVIVGIYFLSVGIGYGMTDYWDEYDMNTGCSILKCCDLKTKCYFDKGKAFFGGCSSIGILYILPSAIVITISMLLLMALYVMIEPLYERLKSEIITAFAFAKKNTELEEIKVYGTF
jgi:hypothetical protein